MREREKERGPTSRGRKKERRDDLLPRGPRADPSDIPALFCSFSSSSSLSFPPITVDFPVVTMHFFSAFVAKKKRKKTLSFQSKDRSLAKDIFSVPFSRIFSQSFKNNDFLTCVDGDTQ